MKYPLLALLCAATPALCQSPAPHPVDPNQMFQPPEVFAQATPDLSRPAITQKFSLPPMLDFKVLKPGPRNLGPGLDSPQIDPKIIVHPPWPRSTDEPKGQEVSRHLYSNLRFMPLRKARPLR